MSFLRRPLLAASGLLLLLSACRFNNEDKAEHHERIVSLSKQYSEIIYALGAERDLVAVDLSSTYPPAIKALPTVGYHRALSAEGIASVKPTLILHDNNVGPEHVMRQLEELKLPMKVFSNKGTDVASTQALITEMGGYFHKEARAAELNKTLGEDMARALASAKGFAKKPKVMVIHFGRAMNIYLTMTRGSTAGQMIQWAGGEIPVEGKQGMLQLSPEVIAQADPDVILLTDFGYDRLGSPEQVATLPGVGSTRAVKNGRVYRVEEHDLVYIGPRTGANVLELQRMIHAGDAAL
ncbi:ABC transporter substrate-binding protein [Aggregicoccus sp. 17bor-14]|uniref:heme/hemin ABC transporter substrate-binding protein n=1 Tax=Myxococcaceae TaxID=31 RepID=UPI00129C3123|nr:MULTISPECIES: ABC transporter substrate-binding protein [Myxococcaceae]MBF5041923.1 ABC transporter substrate-binding protein [Simulacricoccus sp. 17bor-14]MRI87704.1 ABC transporter substrate-binding protein [Aggregicoccus sp. 17bor-14]